MKLICLMKIHSFVLGSHQKLAPCVNFCEVVSTCFAQDHDLCSILTPCPLNLSAQSQWSLEEKEGVKCNDDEHDRLNSPFPGSGWYLANKVLSDIRFEYGTELCIKQAFEACR